MKELFNKSFGFPLEDIFKLKESPKSKTTAEKYLVACRKHNKEIVYHYNTNECPLCVALEKIRELEGDCEALQEDLQNATVPAAGSL